MDYLKSFYKDGRLHIYSILLFVSTFLWMALPFNTGPDMNIQKWVGAIQMILPDRQKPSPEDIIFIDVSKSRYLQPLDDDSIENDVITNRKYLTELFTLLAENGNRVKYILCDVKFDMPTPDDSLLVMSVSALKEKFLTIDTYTKDELFKNILDVRSATASLYMQRNVVYKIPFTGIYGDTLVPFKMHVELDKVRVRKNFLFTWFSGKGLAFNHQIHQYPLRSSDFTDGNYVKIGLGELVSTWRLSPELFDLYIKDRYLLIGDFENDRHNTYLNKQPGTLILFNAYLHLHLDRHILSVWYLIILYIFLHWIVWLQKDKKKHHLKFKLKIKFFKPFEIPVNILSVSLLLMIFSYFSSLVFNVNISIFHLITIFSIVDFIRFVWNKRIRDDNQLNALIEVPEGDKSCVKSISS